MNFPYIKINNECSDNLSKQIGWVIQEAAPLNEDEISISVDMKNTVDNGRRVIGVGRLQRANRKNRNGRYYPANELFSQLKCPRTIELLKTGFGSENGHPMDTSLVRQKTIDPNNVVAYFLDLWQEGDYVMGKFIGSNLSIGDAFDKDLRSGLFLPAWSLRGLGSLETTKNGAEVKGLKVITWDRVYYPSHPEAYTQKVLGESANEYTKTESGLYIPNTPNPKTTEKINESGLLTPITNQKVIDYIKTESTNFKQIVESFELMYDSITMLDEFNVQLADSKSGSIFVVQPERFIKQNIMDFCCKY